MTANVMDRIMSTSIIILDQNVNANHVDTRVFEPSALFPPAAVWGGGGVEHMVQTLVSYFNTFAFSKFFL